MQHKTRHPVQFEITATTREALQQWIKTAKLKSEDFLFPSRLHKSPHWAAAGFDDTDLSFLSFLELYGTEIAERRMPARRVVEALDVVEHI